MEFSIFPILHNQSKGVYASKFAMLIFLLSFSACKKDKMDNVWSPPKTGDYFTCVINGERFESKGSAYTNGTVFYYYNAGETGLDNSYILAKGTNTDESLAIAIRISGVEPTTGTFDMLEPTFADSCFPYYRNNQFIYFENLEHGHISISEFSSRVPDTGEFGSFEGSFEFTVTNDSIATPMEVTEGLFRFEVPNMW